MSTSISCSRCGATTTVAALLPGVGGTCRKCGAALPVGQRDAGLEDDDLAPSELAPSRPAAKKSGRSEPSPASIPAVQKKQAAPSATPREPAAKPAPRTPASGSSADSFFSDELQRAASASQTAIPLNVGRVGGSGLFNDAFPWIVGGGGVLVLFVAIAAYLLFKPVTPPGNPPARSTAAVVPSPVAAEMNSTNSVAGNAPIRTGSAVPPTYTPVKPKPTATPTATASSPWPDVVAAARRSVVHLTVKNQDGQLLRTGSGFVIGRYKEVNWQWAKVQLVRPRSVEGDLCLVVTNRRVIAGGWTVDARLPNGEVVEALAVVHQDANRDLVLLAFDRPPDDLQALPLAAADKGRPEEEVVAVGHALGTESTSATGVIREVCGTTQLPEEIAEWVRAPVDQQWIRSTASLASEQSGGPLLNARGEVIGLNTWDVDLGEKQSFAVHVRYLHEFMSITYDAATNERKVTLWPFYVIRPLEGAYNLGNRADWQEPEVNSELNRAVERALEIGWKPGSRGDYYTFQTAAQMLSLAEVFGYPTPGEQVIVDSLQAKQWDFDAEVSAINRYALLAWRERRWPAFMLGKVRLINKLNRRRFWVDLLGRGYVVAVTIPTTSEPPDLQVGDGIAVFGQYVGALAETKSMPMRVDNVVAGLITKVTLPEPPADAALLAAYDLLKKNRSNEECQARVRSFVGSFPYVVPLVGKTSVRWQRVGLNRRGRQFDAVRFTVPKDLPCDLIWSFNHPGGSIESWGIMPVKNFPLPWEANHWTVRGVRAPGLSEDESAMVTVQGLGHGILVPGEDYLLWFLFKDEEPRSVMLTTRLVPVDSFNPANDGELGPMMRDGMAFSPEVLSRYLKAQQADPLVKPSPKSDDK